MKTSKSAFTSIHRSGVTKGALGVMAAITCSAAFAATDGTLDAVSSVGTYTNTFGSTVPNGRKVQVLDLKDAAVLSSTPFLLAEAVSQYPGVRDSFCVTDNAGGKVRIKFSNANGEANWTAKSILGTNLGYRLLFAPTTTGQLNFVGVNGVVDFTSSVLTAAACGATGNVSKGVTAVGASITTNVTFIDTVIVTVTPI